MTVESLLRDLDAAGAPSLTAPPYLAEKVLARRRHRRQRRGALALVALVAAGTVGARSVGQSRFAYSYVPSGPMEPTLHIGERLVFDRTLTPSYGDVVVVDAARDGQSFTARLRVIGLPGDVVSCPAAADGTCHGWTRDGVVLDEPYVANGEPGSAVVAPVTVAAGQMWLLGDDRGNAVDSRMGVTYLLSRVEGVGVAVEGTDGRLRKLSGAPEHEGPSGNIDPGSVPPAQSAPV